MQVRAHRRSTDIDAQKAYFCSMSYGDEKHYQYTRENCPVLTRKGRAHSLRPKFRSSESHRESEMLKDRVQLANSGRDVTNKYERSN